MARLFTRTVHGLHSGFSRKYLFNVFGQVDGDAAFFKTVVGGAFIRIVILADALSFKGLR